MNKSPVTLAKDHKGIHWTANMFLLLLGLKTRCLTIKKGQMSNYQSKLFQRKNFANYQIITIPDATKHINIALFKWLHTIHLTLCTEFSIFHIKRRVLESNHLRRFYELLKKMAKI